MQFLEFVDRKQRETIRHLQIMKKVFDKIGFEVKSHIDDEDPYLFVKSPKSLSFEGVRIYEVGDTIAYRIQKEEDTHPYGKSYSLDVQNMFHDFMSENIKEKVAGRKVIDAIKDELNSFFEKSAEAEDDLISQDDERNVILKTGGTDYSTTVLKKL
jgi:hypothetical protein